MMPPSNATMSDVPEDLRVLVEQALAEGRRQLTNSGSVEPLFLVRLPGGKVQRATLPPPMNQLMDSGEAKGRIFGFVRDFVKMHGVTATVFMTDAWIGLPTEKQMGMIKEDPEALRRIVNAPDFNLDEGERLGLCKRVETLMINVQTEAEVVLVEQRYTRYQAERRVEFGQRTVTRLPQDGFRGRQKMYGVRSRADII